MLNQLISKLQSHSDKDQLKALVRILMEETISSTLCINTLVSRIEQVLTSLLEVDSANELLLASLR